MAPRLYGIRERRDQPIYDTLVDPVPNRRYRLFGNVNAGQPTLCNLLVANQVSLEGPYVILSLGARIPGMRREHEDELLDHFLVTLTMGPQQREMFTGHASLMRQPTLEDWAVLRDALMLHEVQALARRHRCPIDIVDADSVHVATDWLMDKGVEPAISVPMPAGYRLARPIIIPVRQTFDVTVCVDNSLPGGAVHALRITLFGLETRETTFAD